MKLVHLLAILIQVLGAGPASMTARKAKSDFAPSANAGAGHWKNVAAVKASVDPFGKPSSAAFEFKTLWTKDYLYILYICPFDELVLKDNPATGAETNQLWNWDVTELFIGSMSEPQHRYREYQVSPQAEWVDLDIDRQKQNPDGWKWNSNFLVAARIDKANKIWYGEMKIPIASIQAEPAKAGTRFRLNQYRLSGKVPTRQSTMWTPTNQRSHHTPEAFGILTLVD
jgi:hypothetical protein